MSPKEDYATLEWAKAGDTVEIAPGTYQFRVYLNNHGTAQKPIIIKAKDPGNPPVWDLSGRDCGSWPGSYNQGDLKRGAWQIQGSHYFISDIVFKNAHTTRGGGIGDSSGLRVKGGYNITIRNCRFEGNDNGVSGFGENILYENCVFTKNGSNGQGDRAHNIYLHGGSQTFRYCRITDAKEGQNIHLRGKRFRFEYCWIENEGTYMGDLMVSESDWSRSRGLDSTLTLIGCVIIGAPNPMNDTKFFTMYNSPPAEKVSMRINMYYNTLIGNGKDAAVIRFTDSGLEKQEAYLYNNIFIGNHVPFRFDTKRGVVAVADTNWWPSGYDYSTYGDYATNLVLGTDPGFVHRIGRDYRLRKDASAANLARTELGEIPTKEMVVSSGKLTYRLRSNANDLGAFSRIDAPGAP